MTRPGKRLPVKREVRIRVYPIVQEAVDQGVEYGWIRAHEYTESPTPEAIQNAIADEVMAALSEIIDWGDP